MTQFIVTWFLAGWAEWRRNNLDHSTFAQGKTMSVTNTFYCVGLDSILCNIASWKVFQKHMKGHQGKARFRLLVHHSSWFLKSTCKWSTRCWRTPVMHLVHCGKAQWSMHRQNAVGQQSANMLATDCFLFELVFQPYFKASCMKKSLGCNNTLYLSLLQIKTDCSWFDYDRYCDHFCCVVWRKRWNHSYQKR